MNSRVSGKLSSSEWIAIMSEINPLKDSTMTGS